MLSANWLLMLLGGLFSGLLAGLLGIGGGTVLVPLLVTFGSTPVEAVATSSLAIVMTSIAGSLQNWRMGFLDFRRVLYLGLPSLVTAQFGAYLADQMSDYLLLTTFGIFLIFNLFLSNLRQRVAAQENSPENQVINPILVRLGTGGAAGLLAGLFGVGGGLILVPLQMLLLGEKIKVAIITSLGVIVITAISATFGHAMRGNVLFYPGLILGAGGVVGSQISTRFLPKLPDKFVSFCFSAFLVILAVYTFWRALSSY
ncbi:MAG: sulfite exporter TauE/SafE family protein [Gomphosphaeria aponina SAG 52.96 = DSM 107014]|uniref:Probable membrane transporter protein n=1 Tax=Gomphosphaeria aponina SAG 52.96 = DSM 107014 TaxID=1521640 RepID=A0A941GP55_9CHRO|nr:sulfite exporter TauE/SafE family protein [Gomphosphaeria aponina SAG 52.96 = DSM 107014]